MLEYVLRFDQLLRYALNMVSTEWSKIWRFLSGLRPSLASLVDTRKVSPKSYPNIVGHAIR